MGMTSNQSFVLPLLFVAIVANTLVMAYILIANRMEARRRAIAGREASVQQTLATSYVDRLDRMHGLQGETIAGFEAFDPEPGGGPGSGASARDATPGRAGVAPDTPPDGVLTASAFEAQLAHEDERLRRYARPTTVIVIELEGLDRLAERLGSDMAERLIPAVADSIRQQARASDVVGMLGEGRFGVLLPETDEIAAINHLERVRDASERWLESDAVELRLVFGWASTTGELTLPETQQVALQRMRLESRRDRGRGEPPAPVAIDVAPEPVPVAIDVAPEPDPVSVERSEAEPAT
jgi:diguanylate cyclase (GGDEF)-like protein